MFRLRLPSGATAGDASARPPIYKDLLLIQLAILVFLIDQFSKFLVRELLVLRESFPATGFLRITHTFNTGSAFGLFQDQNTPLILVSLVGITVLVIIYRSQRLPSGLLRLSLGLQMGGAVGNLLDRVRLGHVTDWVDVGPWPVFNVADASIVTGLVLLAWLFIGAERAPPPAGNRFRLGLVPNLRGRNAFGNRRMALHGLRGQRACLGANPTG